MKILTDTCAGAALMVLLSPSVCGIMPGGSDGKATEAEADEKARRARLLANGEAEDPAGCDEADEMAERLFAKSRRPAEELAQPRHGAIP